MSEEVTVNVKLSDVVRFANPASLIKALAEANNSTAEHMLRTMVHVFGADEMRRACETMVNELPDVEPKVSKVYRKVTIPITADDWELFPIDGVDKAAEEMTEALKEAMDTFVSAVNDGKRPVVAFSFVENVFRGTMEKNGRFGAFDTEPRENFRYVMKDLAETMGVRV